MPQENAETGARQWANDSLLISNANEGKERPEMGKCARKTRESSAVTRAVMKSGGKPSHSKALACGKMLDAVRLGEHGQAALGNQEAATAVQGVIEPDLDPRRYLHRLVDDRPPDLGVPAHVHALE